MRYRPGITAAALALCAMLPLPAQPASDTASIGVGPHGYDFLIGSWSCKNMAPSPMQGPSTIGITIARTATGALTFHAVGTGFDGMGYILYAAKTKTWWNPSTLASGGYGTESSQQTGKKTVWSGPFTDPATGKTMRVRDTYTFPNMSTYTDLYQAEEGGTWKTLGDSTCTKG